VLRAVPAHLRRTERLHVAARRAFRAMHVRLSRTLPAWRVVAPAPEPDLLSFYREGERRFGVPWEVLAAVNLVETGMGRIRGTSVAGARGPMQFMPGTWARFGRGDIDDPRDAIIAAARYLAHNGAGRGHVDRALFAYNRSARYVRGVQAYAAVLRADPAALRGLYDWQVVYLSRRGDVWLPEGYAHRRPVGVGGYLRRHPDRLLTSSVR
jgi:soluble lytic murein transglycosylase-like protein